MQWVFDGDPCWTATSRPEAFRTPVWAGGTWNSDHKVTIEVILQYCQEKCGGLHTKSNYAFPGMWFLSNCPFCAGSISVCNRCAIFNGMVGLDVTAKLLVNIGFSILLASTTRLFYWLSFICLQRVSWTDCLVNLRPFHSTHLWHWFCCRLITQKGRCIITL